MIVNQGQKPGTEFEERLLSRLQGVVAERGAAAEAEAVVVEAPRRRAPRLALGGAVAAAAVTAGLIVSAGGDNAPAAYAVESQADGGVNIEIYELSDSAGLEGALAKAGIPAQVNYLPAGMVCREPHFTPSKTIASPEGTGKFFRSFGMGGPNPISITVGDGFEEPHQGELADGERSNIHFDPSEFGADETLVLSGFPAPYHGDPTGGSVVQVQIAEGEVGPCEPVQDENELNLLTEP
jgi:hypothetical protein